MLFSFYKYQPPFYSSNVPWQIATVCWLAVSLTECYRSLRLIFQRLSMPWFFGHLSSVYLEKKEEVYVIHLAFPFPLHVQLLLDTSV